MVYSTCSKGKCSLPSVGHGDTLGKRGILGAIHVSQVPEQRWPRPLPFHSAGVERLGCERMVYGRAAASEDKRIDMVLGTTKCLHETWDGRFSSASRSPWSL